MRTPGHLTHFCRCLVQHKVLRGGGLFFGQSYNRELSTRTAQFSNVCTQCLWVQQCRFVWGLLSKLASAVLVTSVQALQQFLSAGRLLDYRCGSSFSHCPVCSEQLPRIVVVHREVGTKANHASRHPGLYVVCGIGEAPASTAQWVSLTLAAPKTGSLEWNWATRRPLRPKDAVSGISDSPTNSWKHQCGCHICSETNYPCSPRFRTDLRSQCVPRSSCDRISCARISASRP